MANKRFGTYGNCCQLCILLLRAEAFAKQLAERSSSRRWVLVMQLNKLSAFSGSKVSRLPIFVYLVYAVPSCAAIPPQTPAHPAPAYRVLYFWSSSCPCVRACERYSFIPLAEKYNGVVSLFAKHHLPYPVVLDTTHRLALKYGAQVAPQTFVLDPAGHVIFNGMPDDSRRFLFDPPKAAPGKSPIVPNSYLAKALAEALAGKPVTQSPLKETGCSIAW